MSPPTRSAGSAPPGTPSPPSSSSAGLLQVSFFFFSHLRSGERAPKGPGSEPGAERLTLAPSRERVDLLHLPAQLQQHRHQRGALLRQDAVPVCLLDHHAGLHPAGALLPGRLLRLRLLLPAGPG